MSKRTQLNINIDESLLKELKQLALLENLALSVFVRNSLRDIVSGERGKILSTKQEPFTEKHAINCTSFMKGIFQKMRVKNIFRNDLDAFSNLLSHIEKSKQWNDIYTNRLKEVLLDETATPFKAEELNDMSKSRECECPIYFGLKEWTGCIEYPTQDLICDLGGSLVLLIENQF